MLPGSSVAFLDPWGNRVEVVEYRDVQFTKADTVLRGMEIDGAKSEKSPMNPRGSTWRPAVGLVGPSRPIRCIPVGSEA